MYTPIRIFPRKGGLPVTARKIIKRSLTAGETAPFISELTSFKDQQSAIKCRNRKFLAGSNSNSFPEFLPTAINKYFKGIKVNQSLNNGNLGEVGSKLRPIFDDYLRKDFNAILVKNLPISNPDDFRDLVKGLDYRDMSYAAGTGYRERLNDRVYTSSDEPPEFCIEPHNEMSYLDNFPTKFMICCIKPSDIGGESPLVFNRDLLEAVDKDVMEKLKRKGVRYLRNMKHEKNASYYTWQQSFELKCEKKVEEKMRNTGIKWKWYENGDLTIWTNLSATTVHPITKEEVWFNQAAGHHCTFYKSHPMYEHQQDLEPNEYPNHCCYGDGEEIEDHVIDHLRAIQYNNAMTLKLEQGDVVLLDNMLAQHTRIGCEGERLVLVHLADSIKDKTVYPDMNAM